MTLGRWITRTDRSCVTDLTLAKDKFEAFYTIMSNAVDLYLPKKRVRVCPNNKPWVTPKLTSLIRQRKNALSTLGKDSARFKDLRNRVQRECKTARARFYNNKVSTLKESNVSRWWKEVKALSGLTASSEWWHQMLGEAIPTVDALAERFNEFLCDLTSNFIPLPESAVELVPVPQELLVCRGTVFSALRSIKVKKSSGPDPVPAVVWKEFAFELADVIKDLYNSSLEQGVVPVQIKESIVHPLPNCNPPKSVEEDLRPITLTSHLAKVMEGFTLNSLSKQVKDKLDPKQFSINGKSTVQALVYLLHIILASFDRGDNYARIFFADFSKGFDLVDHNALTEELKHLDVSQCLIRWIGAFLSLRPQRVMLNGSLSPPVFPNEGIPQGTRLAPLLFAILVNGLASFWPCRVKYVDDTTVFEIIPRCSPSYLPCMADHICQFATERGMRLNPKKCREMVINFLQFQPTQLGPLQLMGSVVKRVNSYKILGIHVTNDLSWNVHIDYVFKKANKRLYALRLLARSKVPAVDLIAIYCALVRSILEYGSPVWAALPEYLSDVVEGVQRKALQIVFPGLAYNEALVASGLQTLATRRVQACVNFLRDARAQEPLRSVLTSTASQTNYHGYTLRSGNTNLIRQPCNTKRLCEFVTYKYS